MPAAPCVKAPVTLGAATAASAPAASGCPAAVTLSRARTMWFTRLSIGNPVLATMMMMALVVLGLFSYQRLKVDQFPDIELPTLVVQMAYPGASPEIIETEVTRKVEEAVNTRGRHQPALLALLRRQLGRHHPVQHERGRAPCRRGRAREALGHPPPDARRGRRPTRAALRPGQPPHLLAGPHLARRQPEHPGLDHLRRPDPAQAPGERRRRGQRQPGGRPQAPDQRLPAPRRP